MAVATVVTDSPTPGRTPRAGAWLLIAPLIVWLIVFVIAPIAIMMVISFCQKKEGSVGVIWSFDTSAYAQVINLELFKALAWAAFWGGLGAALVCGAILGAGRVWPIVADWFARRWRVVVVVLVVVIGWGAFRQYVISRVEGRSPDQLTAAQELVQQRLSMLKIFIVSIDYAAWSTIICVIVGYPVAYYMGRASPGMRNLLLLLIMVPFWTSFLIRTYAWVTILNTQGVLNDFLLWANIVSQPLDLMPSGTAVMIGLVYTYLPFMILPIYTSCERLDQSLIDASFDLGANPFRSFWTVILPLTRPGVVAGIIITFVPAIGMFAVNDILGGRREQLIGNVISNQLVGQGRNWPLGAALGMVLMMMFVVTYYMAARKRGTVVG